MNTYFRKSYIVFSTLIILMSSIVGILMPNDVSAAPKTLDDYTKSFIYYTAWEKCMSSASLASGSTSTDRISAENVSNGIFFTNLGSIYLGYLNNGESENCNTANGWTSQALQFWGWSDKVSALCSFGFTRQSPGGGQNNYDKCVNGTGDFINTNSDKVTPLKKAIEEKYYGKRGRPTLTEAQQYWLYYNSFLEICKAKPEFVLDTATPEQKLKLDLDNYYKVITLDANYNLRTVVYSAELGKGRNIDIYTNTGQDRYPPNISCFDMVNLFNQKSGAYQTYVSKNKSTEPKPMSTAELISSGGGPSDGTTPDSTTTCAIDGIGWIICPVVTFLSGVADKAFEFLADNFLMVSPEFLKTDGPTFIAWQQILVFANIGLVIFFILIIFSQITGFGISNYGIKKMLPKLIITVILMNLSFFIVQISADISNILGYTLRSFFSNIGNQIADPNLGFQAEGFSYIAPLVLAGGLAGGGAVVASGGFSAALVALLPVLLAGLIALIMIFFILIARQVLLILLTVLAPLAFLAYLLPNTEKWFTKWYKTLFALLMVFPIVGIIFGISGLASQIVTGAMNTDSGSVLGQIIGAAIMTLPLFFVPVILKKSLDSIPAISGKINSLGSKFSGKATGSAKDRLGKSYMGQKAAYNRKQADIRRAQIQGGTYSGRFGRFNPRNLASGAFAGVNASSLSGRFGDLSAARGAQIAQSQEEENIKNADSYLTSGNFSRDALKKMIMGEEVKDSRGRVVKVDDALKRAAVRRYIPTAGVEDVHNILEARDDNGISRLGSMSQAVRNDLASSIASSSLSERASYLGGETLSGIQTGNVDLAAAALNSIRTGKVSSESLAKMDTYAIKHLDTSAASGTAERDILIKAATGIYGDDRIRSTIADGSEKDKALAPLTYDI